MNKQMVYTAWISQQMAARIFQRHLKPALESKMIKIWIEGQSLPYPTSVSDESV